MADLPKKIGKYEIRSSLGEGAMGIVYEGFDPDIERRVAIKILHPYLINEKNGAEFLERFKREAKSAARCTHPNIVTVLEYGQDQDTPYIVMEFVEGSSLQEIVNRGRGVTLQKTLSIVSQMLKALHAAHQMTIIHRDVKTANVIILKDGGSVKLADFGIARVAESSELTMTGAIVGTPKFMAPEQMFGLKVDTRADLFSATMVFLELLSLLPKSSPIPRSSLPEIANLPPNNRINYSVLYPTALIPVLLKGLAVRQEDRYQTARDFVQDIKNVLPKLKSAMATPSQDATAVVRRTEPEAEAASPTNQDELDSLTNLLIDYVGPIAKNIMVAHDRSDASVNDLASEMAREIPEPDERDEFLRRWENISGTRLGSSRISDLENTTAGSRIRSFDDEMLEKMGRDYAGYIGPLAGRLIRHHSSRTTSLEQLVEWLADEIPDTGDSRKFRDLWLRA